MEILVRMKTGFFEMKPYRLKAEERRLSLIPFSENEDEVIVLAEKDIVSVTLKEGRFSGLEIQTRDKPYSGILEEGNPLAEVINHLKENLNINITCEYKGEKKHA